MKKLVLLLAVAFSVSMFSCGKGEKVAATDSPATDSNAQVEAVQPTPADTPVVATDTNTVAAE